MFFCDGELRTKKSVNKFGGLVFLLYLCTRNKRDTEMNKVYIYKKNCNTGVTETYTYVSSEENAKDLVSELNRWAPYPYTYFYLPN